MAIVGSTNDGYSLRSSQSIHIEFVLASKSWIAFDRRRPSQKIKRFEIQSKGTHVWKNWEEEMNKYIRREFFFRKIFRLAFDLYKNFWNFKLIFMLQSITYKEIQYLKNSDLSLVLET